MRKKIIGTLLIILPLFYVLSYFDMYIDTKLLLEAFIITCKAMMLICMVAMGINLIKG